MTANELAEALDYIGEHYYAGWGNVIFKDAAIFVNKQAEQIEILQNDIVKQQEFVCQQAQEIEALKKENEDRESAIYATGYWNGISKKNERA
jgi:uncharacterized membrane protein YgaE (UPF0421/DUF939 family)